MALLSLCPISVASTSKALLLNHFSVCQDDALLRGPRDACTEMCSGNILTLNPLPPWYACPYQCSSIYLPLPGLYLSFTGNSPGHPRQLTCHFLDTACPSQEILPVILGSSTAQPTQHSPGNCPQITGRDPDLKAFSSTTPCVCSQPPSPICRKCGEGT